MSWSGRVKYIFFIKIQYLIHNIPNNIILYIIIFKHGRYKLTRRYGLQTRPDVSTRSSVAPGVKVPLRFISSNIIIIIYRFASTKPIVL